MLNFLITNLGTIIVAVILLLIVTAIIMKLVSDKKKGGCASCDGCSGACHYSSECSSQEVSAPK